METEQAKTVHMSQEPADDRLELERIFNTELDGKIALGEREKLIRLALSLNPEKDRKTFLDSLRNREGMPPMQNPETQDDAISMVAEANGLVNWSTDAAQHDRALAFATSVFPNLFPSKGSGFYGKSKHKEK